jgi:nitrilase
MLKIALAQLAPIWLQREATLAKVMDSIQAAAAADARLVVFGEALVPGYPFWVEATDGARFNSDVQKDLFAHYLTQAVCIEAGHLAGIQALAKAHGIAVVLGTIERPLDRGGHSLYCSLVYIDATGAIANVHRKLMPTYEERLVWSPGDGHGLRTFPLEDFRVGMLNCWENWMPLPRAALYAQGENLHLAVWPGNARNTELTTRFQAREGRSYAISVCGLMRREDVPAELPHRELILAGLADMPADGGTAVANPDGSWLLPPIVGREALEYVELDIRQVYRERQNFDPSGHYSRPDVTQLTVDHTRQQILRTRQKAD